MWDDEGTRLADLRISPVGKFFLRWIYPPVLTWALWRRWKAQREAEAVAAKMGAQLAEIVIEARRGSRTLRRLTGALAAMTLVSTAFVVYSAVWR
jgi:hypothetical protein